jgi:nucleoside-diphosphate-sugar epimerase
MRVFVTGASGHIGSFVVPELLGAGHTVVGLARSDASAAAIEVLGVEVHRGDLADPAGIAAVVADVDGVIHLAFNHQLMAGGDFAGAAQEDLAVVEAFGNALTGTGKAYVAVGIAPTGDAKVDARTAQNPRAAVSRLAAGFADREIRSTLVAVPPVTHSEQDVGGFVPSLVATARRTGVSAYAEDGVRRWPAAHTSDIARLFRLALEEAPAGSQFYGAVETALTQRDIAEAIARHLDVLTQSISREDAPEHFGHFAQIMLLDFPPMDSVPTRQLLSWEPTGIGLLAEIDTGHYFTAS